MLPRIRFIVKGEITLSLQALQRDRRLKLRSEATAFGSSKGFYLDWFRLNVENVRTVMAFADGVYRWDVFP